MKRLSLAERKVLRKIYELTDGVPYINVSMLKIGSALNLSNEKIMSIMVALNFEKLAQYSFAQTCITPDGIEEIEKTMERTYEEKEYVVLKELFDKTRVNSKGLSSSEIAQSLELEKEEVDYILIDFQRKEWAWLTAGITAQISPQGVTAFNTWEKDHTPQKVIGDSYYTNNYGPSNNMIGGHHNTQNAQINTNPEFDKAINSMAEIINSSSMSSFVIKDLLMTIEHLKTLPAHNPSKELAEHGKSKTNYLELAVKGSDIALKLGPHIQTLYNYFNSLIP